MLMHAMAIYVHLHVSVLTWTCAMGMSWQQEYAAVCCVTHGDSVSGLHIDEALALKWARLRAGPEVNPSRNPRPRISPRPKSGTRSVFSLGFESVSEQTQ